MPAVVEARVVGLRRDHPGFGGVADPVGAGAGGDGAAAGPVGGILLDTLIVRTILIPASLLTIGDRIWWPSQGTHQPF